jgi:hypothetical protein
MKKWLTLSLALVIAAVSQAVTVAWAVPNQTNNPGWVNEITSAYYVYSTKELGSVGGDCADVYTAQTSPDNSDYTQTGYTQKVGAYMPRDPVIVDPENGDQYGLFGSPTIDPTIVGKDGVYMYLVVVKEENVYAVAGGIKLTYDSETDSYANSSKGVYQTSAEGTAPDYGEYLDFDIWLGGTWKDVGAPEPTVLALLALGVAGVALRRKQNFTK